MAKAFGYSRVSTTKQADEGVSLSAQQAKIAAWAEFSGYELAGIETDAGLSGGRYDNRPGLLSVLKAAKRGDAIVVYSLSRLARSVKDTIEIVAELERRGVDLVSLSEKLDTSTAAGKLMFHLVAAFSEFEKAQLGERTKAAMAHKAAKGERVGKVPFGFDLAADGVSLVPNEEEQRACQIVRQLRESGLSLRAIAQELNTRGISTKEGGAWAHQSVERILKRVA